MNPSDRLLVRLILCGAGALCIPLVASHAEPMSDLLQGSVSHASGERDGQRDFDFHFGVWKTHVSRLLQPLSGSTTWAEYEGTSTVSEVWDGRASLFELDVDGPEGRIQGAGLRLYNPRSHQWSLNWASRSDGIMTPPMTGAFEDGRGDFFGQETFDGRVIYTRNSFSEITPDSSRFEQAFSNDGGKTWETNWVMTFTRMKGESGQASQ